MANLSDETRNEAIFEITHNMGLVKKEERETGIKILVPANCKFNAVIQNDGKPFYLRYHHKPMTETELDNYYGKQNGEVSEKKAKRDETQREESKKIDAVVPDKDHVKFGDYYGYHYVKSPLSKHYEVKFTNFEGHEYESVNDFIFRQLKVWTKKFKKCYNGVYDAVEIHNKETELFAEGTKMKLEQNPYIMTIFSDITAKYVVEYNPFIGDRWGIGIGIDDERIKKPDTWDHAVKSNGWGKIFNRGGAIITELRKELRKRGPYSVNNLSKLMVKPSEAKLIEVPYYFSWSRNHPPKGFVQIDGKKEEPSLTIGSVGQNDPGFGGFGGFTTNGVDIDPGFGGRGPGFTTKKRTTSELAFGFSGPKKTGTTTGLSGFGNKPRTITDIGFSGPKKPTTPTIGSGQVTTTGFIYKKPGDGFGFAIPLGKKAAFGETTTEKKRPLFGSLSQPSQLPLPPVPMWDQTKKSWTIV